MVRARAQATATRLAIVCRLQSRASFLRPPPSLAARGRQRTRQRRVGDAGRRRGIRRDDEPSAAATTHLAAFAAGVTRFIGGPFVRRPFFVSGTTALARNLPLLLGRHRREPSSFFTFCTHRSASVCLSG